jgi:dTDP-glucose 4,6-dehydratase
MLKKRVLLTGIGGFVGSHCLEYFLANTDWQIIGIDSFKHKGDLNRLSHIDFKDRVKILYHDLSIPISDPLLNLMVDVKIDHIGQLITNKIDYIVNIASDSAVDRSIDNPVACLRNNYELMINMLELARIIKPKKFIHISTDEVYGEANFGSNGHTEWDNILPSNPYAASKAAQEALAISYWRTFNIPIVITNTMNIIGERQDPEKFLPKIIQKIFLNQELFIYSDSDQIGSRIYLDAKNQADALMCILDKPVSLYEHGNKRPDRWNVCGDIELNNLELAELVSKIMNKKLRYKLIPSESVRPGYDKRYCLDGTKLKNSGWKPPYSFETSLKRIVTWTLNNPHWVFDRNLLTLK